MAEKHFTDEFSAVSKLLANADVDADRHRERIYRQLKFKLETETIGKNQKGDEVCMKKRVSKTIAITVITSACLLGGFSATAFGQDMIRSIIGQFHIGGMTITQYDQELPPDSSKVDNTEQTPRENREVQTATIEEARTAMDTRFAVPGWLPDGYQYTNSVIHSPNGVELQYTKGQSLVSLLISKGENGIGTTGDVDKATLGGQTVYFANGIVLWAQDGLTYELYQMAEKGFDRDTLGKIIGEVSVTGVDSALYSDR